MRRWWPVVMLVAFWLAGVVALWLVVLTARR